jgi:hypothetical protein
VPGTSCHDALLLKLVELCRFTAGFPTHDKLMLPPVNGLTLTPPSPVPVITGTVFTLTLPLRDNSVFYRLQSR